MPKESTEPDFFLFLIDNRILSEILRDKQVCKTITKKTDSSSWVAVELQELKAFFCLLIAIGFHAPLLVR